MKRSKRLALLFALAVAIIAIVGFSFYKYAYGGQPDCFGELAVEPFLHGSSDEKAALIAGDTCGKLLDSRDDVVQGAHLDKISLSSRESAQSPRTIERRAILLRYPGAEATIIVSHGFMCDKYDSFFLRNLFPSKKYNVLTFDYRAHGEKREGQQCTFGKDEVYDLIAAARFIKHYQETSGKPLYVYGFSMGAATSLLAQAQEPNLFSAMVLDCPYDSTESIVKKSIENLRFSVCGYDFCFPGNGILKKYAFHPYVQSLIKTLLKSMAQIDSSAINTCIHPVHPSEAAKNITIPCFFIHCKNDDRVSLDSVKRIYNNYGGVKKLWITNGRRHYDSYFYNPEMYTKRVRKFLDLVGKEEVGKRYKKKIIEDKEDMILGGEWI